MFPNHFAVTCSRDIHIYDSQFNKQLEWKGHSGSVFCLIQLQDRRIVSASSDNVILVWNLDGSFVKWEGHTSSVHYLLQLQDGRIALGSWDDKTIYIYDSQFNKQSEWKGHTSGVYCLIQLHDGRIASGSRDKTIRIWNLDGTSIKWKGHTRSVRCLIQLQDGRIASASYDNTIRIWKRADASGDEDGTSVEWKGHSGSVFCLIQLQDGRIASGSDDNTIRIWMRADASGDEDGTSIEWKGHNLKKIELCDGRITSLIQLYDGRIVSGSYSLWGILMRIWSIDGSSIIVYSDKQYTSPIYIIPIHTKEDLQQGQRLLYELLKDYVVEDVKSIVYQYVKPL